MLKRPAYNCWRILAAALWSWCAVVVPPAVARAGTAQEQQDLEGRRLAAVRLLDQSGAVLEENPPSLAVSAGAAYDSLAVRESLRLLYATGRFAEIRAEVEVLPEGVRLDFVVRQNLFFNRIRIEGLPGDQLLSRATAALQLNLGETFDEEKVSAALERLADTLREEGFYEAALAHQLIPHLETRQMDVTVRVTQGPRARVAAITLANGTTFADRELLNKSRLRAGQQLTPRRLERAGERLRRFLSRESLLGARVMVRRGAYDTTSHSLPLHMEVVAGLRVRIEVTGVQIAQRTLRQLVPVFQEGAIDEDLLLEGRRNLRNHFEREGYFDTAVTYTERADTDKNLRVITYAVARGARRRLAAIEFRGNRYFSNSLLQEQLSIRPATLGDRGRFSSRALAEDEARLRDLYVANGFPSVVVRSAIVEKHAGKEENLLVRFFMSEGAQTRVGDLRIAGADALDPEMLYNNVGSTVGQPYSEFNVAADRDNILAIYFNEGFPEARFVARIEPGSEPGRVHLHYQVTEGAQMRVARVLLAGHDHTRPGVIQRELLIGSGEPLRQGDIVESQRRLYNLGIFSRVQIAPQNPAGAQQDKTLVVLVDEARRYTLAYGAGIEFQRLGSGGDPVSGAFRASPRGLLEISKNNFAGRAHTVSFKARASALQGRGLLSYAVPGFFGRPKLNFLLTGLADKTRDVRTFSSQRYEAGLQVEHRASSATSVLYRYSFRRVLVDAGSLRIDPQQIPLFSQPTRISGFGFTWVRDRRDNPAEALRGNFNTVDVGLNAKPLGSSASFFRLFLQNSTYHPVSRNLLFARSTRLGVQEPFSDTSVAEIPLPERFFAGGGNTLRGFGLNQAGPRDTVTGFPIGGLAMLVFNNELRFPLRLPGLGNKVGGALFYDGGNVFSRISRLSFQRKPDAPTDLNYFSHNVGFGFRYGTPIGPVRIDLGYNLNPARFEFCEPSATPTTPRCPAGQAVTTRRLPRFQIFFNIGSFF
jgi:outer membrane protein assembly complex protein YaeT